MERLYSERKKSKNEIIEELSITNMSLLNKVKRLERENKKLKRDLFFERSQTKLLERRLELAEDS